MKRKIKLSMMQTYFLATMVAMVIALVPGYAFSSLVGDSVTANTSFDTYLTGTNTTTVGAGHEWEYDIPGGSAVDLFIDVSDYSIRYQVGNATYSWLSSDYITISDLDFGGGASIGSLTLSDVTAPALIGDFSFDGHSITFKPDHGVWTANQGATVNINTVPIPGAIWLLGSGLIGMVGIRRKLRS
jgi:hypothetical protein